MKIQGGQIAVKYHETLIHGNYSEPSHTNSSGIIDEKGIYTGIKVYI